MRTPSGNAELHQSTISMDLKRPPVVETSLGCFFTGVEGWNILHFGALWEKFRAKYPKVDFPPAVVQVADPPGHFRLMPGQPVFPIRAVFTDERKTQLVQIQTDLFLHNWRKSDENPAYEHYDHIFPLFKADWEAFTSFLREQKLPRPKLSRCEVTYFNHLVRGENWGEYETFPKLFRFWRGFEKGSVFSKLEAAALNLVQTIGKGKATVVVAPGVRLSDGKEILQVNFTATRTPENSEDRDLFDGLNECHDIALVAFKDIFTDEALKAWRA